MKRFISFLLTSVMLLSLCPVSILTEAVNNDISQVVLPKPEAPRYMVFEGADRTAGEGNDMLYVIRQTDISVLELSTEYHNDSEAFYEKYGLYDFRIIMQYDTSLDGTDNWNYIPEWDLDYSAPSAYEACPIMWIGSNMMEKEVLFDLYHKDPDNDNYSKMADALIRRDTENGDGYTFNNYYFDYENHNLSVRCRYFMQWQTYDGETTGETQIMFSEWSDVAVFGKNGNTITPDEPTGYAAPVISNLKYVAPYEGSEYPSLTYELSTPQSIWETNIYYIMTGNGSFDGLETQISVDGSEWREYETANSWADWGLSAGIRIAHSDNIVYNIDSDVKLRVRYIGTHGPSPWSNTIELNGKEPGPGDANRDGKVNVNDVTLLLKHIAKWDVVIDLNLAEVNDDGKINISDVTLILKYIAKWDVELK